jgi:AraC family transcriptional regulator
MQSSAKRSAAITSVRKKICEVASRASRVVEGAATSLELDAKLDSFFVEELPTLLRSRIPDGCEPLPELLPASGGLSPRQMQQVRRYVHENLESPILILDLSRIAGLSSGYFSRAFKRSFGESPHTFVRGRRVERACHLMLTSDITLSEVAQASGFADQAHLCRQFRSSLDDSPAAWRKQVRKNLALS